MNDCERIHALFSRPGGGTVADCCEELSCSSRTVFRRLETMREAGFTLVQSRCGTWHSTAPKTKGTAKKPKKKARQS